MGCYICSVRSGHLTLKEHEAAGWLRAEELDGLDWLPADRIIVSLLKKGREG
jgi:8-oxo-dGTP diphosphatase